MTSSVVLVEATAEQIEERGKKPKRGERGPGKKSFKPSLLVLPFLILAFVFSYLPLFRWVYSLYDHKPALGLGGSEFVGLQWFRILVSSPTQLAQIGQVLVSTLAISFLGILTSILPLGFAVMLSFRTVCELGEGLRRLASVTGGRVEADVAMLFDWSSWWAAEEPGGLATRLRTVEQLTRWYRVLWRAAVAAGATVVVGPYSGVADERGHVLTGRSPARIAAVLGASGEEWACLPDGDTALEATAAWPSAPAALTASILGERLRADDAEVLATVREGHLAGLPAITRRRDGNGAAWYLGAVLGDEALAAVLTDALADAGVAGVVPGKPDHVEAVRRGDALVLLNHGDTEATVSLASPGRDLLSGDALEGAAVHAPGQTIVLIEGDTP